MQHNKSLEFRKTPAIGGCAAFWRFTRSNLPLVFLPLFAGCGGVLDYQSPAMHVHGVMDKAAPIHYEQPHDRRDMVQCLKDKAWKSPFRHPQGDLVVKENREFNLALSDVKRAGLFWIIPPLGPAGLDFDSGVILTADGLPPRGIIANPKHPKVYWFDPQRKKVVEDVSGVFVIRSNFREKRERSDDRTPGETDVIQLRVKNGTQ